MNGKIFAKNIVDNVEKVIIGKRQEIFNILKGIIAEGHILIEDVPGTGKTTLVKALAKSLNLSYSRIQFTPDLLPSDILGVSIYNPKNMSFEFKTGPIFSNIVLADEINRTSPKTQSALLEVMEEMQVSEGNTTYKLNAPFIVLATQNPVEHEGTFVLPEAQLDRFSIKVKIGYPDKEYEAKILKTYKNTVPLNEIGCIADGSEIIELQNMAKNVSVSDGITNYIIDIVDVTRKSNYLTLGVSTRGALSLLRIAQASALIDGRDYVIPDDVKQNIILTLSHRVSLSSLARANNMTNEDAMKMIVKDIPAPAML